MSEQDPNTVFLCAIKEGQSMFAAQQLPWMLVSVPNWEKRGAQSIFIKQFQAASDAIATSCLQVGNSSSFIFIAREENGCPIRSRGRSLLVDHSFSFCRVERFIKGLDHRWGGSQSRRCRCLTSVLKAAAVPCTYEHNIISYAVFQLCEDVLSLQIKRTGNGLACTGDDGCTLQCNQSHRDYLAQGSY